MKQEKEKKKQKNKKEPFNFKLWMRDVLRSSSQKNAKPPKIEAAFKLLMVECPKSSTHIVIDNEKLLNVSSYTIFSGYSTRIKNLIYSPKKDVDIVFSLVDSEYLTDEKIEEFSANLMQQGVNDFYIYSIKPTSADLNLIYLLKGV